MTAEHCITENKLQNCKENEQWFIQNCKVYMDYYSKGQMGAVSARVRKILKCDKTLDYALLKLDSPIGETYGWLPI